MFELLFFRGSETIFAVYFLGLNLLLFCSFFLANGFSCFFMYSANPPRGLVSFCGPFLGSSFLGDDGNGACERGGWYCSFAVFDGGGCWLFFSWCI